MQSAHLTGAIEKNDVKIFISMLILYAGFGIYFHLNRYLAEHLDFDGLGDFHVALTVAAIVSALIVFGGQAAVHRFVPPYLAQDKTRLAKGFISHYLQLAVKLGGAAVLVALLAAGAFELFSLERWRHEAFLAMVITPLIGLSLFTGAIVQSLRRPFAALVPNEVLRPGLLWLGCMLWLEWFATFNEYQVIGILFLVLCVQLLVQTYLFRATLPFDWRATRPLYDRPAWHKVSRSLLYSGLANTFLDRIDVLALEVLHPDEKSVGIFALLIFVVSPIWMNFSAISSVIAPRIPTLGQAGLQNLFNSTVGSALVANLAMASLIGFYADEILSWLHDDMAAYKTALYVMLAGTAVNCALETASPFIRFGGYQDKVAKVSIYILIANLIVTPSAVHLLGLEGAIASIIGMSFIRGVSYMYILRRFVGIKPLRFA